MYINFCFSVMMTAIMRCGTQNNNITHQKHFRHKIALLLYGLNISIHRWGDQINMQICVCHEKLSKGHTFTQQYTIHAKINPSTKKYSRKYFILTALLVLTVNQSSVPLLEPFPYSRITYTYPGPAGALLFL